MPRGANWCERSRHTNKVSDRQIDDAGAQEVWAGEENLVEWMINQALSGRWCLVT